MTKLISPPRVPEMKYRILMWQCPWVLQGLVSWVGLIRCTFEARFFASMSAYTQIYFRRLSVAFQLWYWPQFLALMSMFANNAVLGGGVRVRAWIREQRKIKRRSEALLCLCWQTWTSLISSSDNFLVAPLMSSSLPGDIKNCYHHLVCNSTLIIC